MFWLNLLFEYISTFFLQFTAALVWGFSFSHSSLGPLKASLPAAPPHSPAWRWLRTHTYLPPLSVFPLEKKGLLNSAFQPYQSSFWNLLLWDDSWKKWHTDCERRFWQVTTLPPTHIWEVLKSFWWATHEQGDFVRGSGLSVPPKTNISASVGAIVLMEGVSWKHSCLCRLVLGFNETQKLFEREVSLKVLTLLLPYLITLQTWTRGGSSASYLSVTVEKYGIKVMTVF